MTTFQKRLENIHVSSIRLFDQEISSIPNILKCTLGEPDFDTPEKIKQAGIQAISENFSHYTGMRGLPALCEAACAFQKEKYNLSYDAQTEVLTTVGVTEAISATLLSILEEGDVVLIPTPAYPGYEPTITLAGATLVGIDTSETNFVLTKEQIETAFAKYGEKIKAIILNYPSNPTGKVLSRDEIKAIAEALSEKEIFIVSDEVYSELIYEKEHTSIAEFLPEKTIVLNGLSKSHAMTGWRIGFIFARKTIIDEIIKVHQYLVTAATTMSQKAGIVALTECQEDVEKMRAEYLVRRNYLMKELSRLDVEYVSPDGAFYLFCKIPDIYSENSWEFGKRLANEAKLAIIPGISFGESGDRYFRISYASSMDVLEQFIAQFGEFLRKAR
ncbi:aminotransferase [Pilibacter termitis]|uniref:Aminotransferase n=1 Tax=Pilibacter termitis TaxID=263852 RepID=A0A1T4MR20_9ENTE|nr:aminotransferase class I/II-fold pyridoxal phosphate-dependent enzyme [Pilibacter termitis]SJZ69168.1 aminotransferase [Pilibacter termitis]